jgi:butanol dehydrogenase
VSNFVFELPTRVVFGPGAVEAVGREAAACGKHALVVTGSTFAKRSGLIDHLHSSLSAAEVKVTLFDRLDQNPTVEAIDEGARVARETGASVVIGLGGGSALDAAKAIAATAAGGKSVWEFTRRGPEVVSLKIEDALPIVQVPIIASTGSETNNTAVIYNPTTHTKASIEGPLLFARVAIVDPALTFSVPARYTAVGAINILSRGVPYERRVRGHRPRQRRTCPCSHGQSGSSHQARRRPRRPHQPVVGCDNGIYRGPRRTGRHDAFAQPCLSSHSTISD